MANIYYVLKISDDTDLYRHLNLALLFMAEMFRRCEAESRTAVIEQLLLAVRASTLKIM